MLIERGNVMNRVAIVVAMAIAGCAAGCAEERHPSGIADTVEGLFGGMPEQYLVSFDPGSAHVSASEAVEVNRVAKDAAASDAPQILLEGHADSIGAKASNQALSLRRAEAVRSLFEAQGVSAGRIFVKAVGEEEPVNRAGFVFADAPHNRVVMIAIFPNRSQGPSTANTKQAAN